jgi:hypothetical protein
MKLDIEKEGFTLKHKEEKNKCVVYTKPYPDHPKENMFVDLLYNDTNNWVFVSQGDDQSTWKDWQPMFAGKIPTQDDLHNVLKMIIVHEEVNA